MRLTNLRLRSRVLLALGLPVLGLLGYSAFALVSLGDAAMRIAMLGEVARVAPSAAALVDALQNERGLSVGHLESDGRDLGDVLRLQRRSTDAALARLESHMPTDRAIGSEAFGAAVQAALGDVARRPDMWRAIDRGSANVGETAAAYTGMVTRILTIVETLAVAAGDARASVASLAYGDLLYPDGRTASRRAAATGSGAGAFEPASLRRLAELTAVHGAVLADLADRAGPEQQALLQRFLDGRAPVGTTPPQRAGFPAGGATAGADGDVSDDEVTRRIGVADAVEDRIVADLVATIDEVRAESRGRFLVGAIALVGMLGLTVALLILLFHSISRPPASGITAAPRAAADDPRVGAAS